MVASLIDSTDSQTTIVFGSVTVVGMLLVQLGLVLHLWPVSRMGRFERAMPNALIAASFGGFVFWLVGFGLGFGDSFYGLFGTTRFAPIGDSPGIGSVFHHLVLGGVATAIVIAAIGDRVRLQTLAFTVLLCTVFQSVFMHWVRGGVLAGEQVGWLSRLGFIDVSGATAVVAIGAWIAVAARMATAADNAELRRASGGVSRDVKSKATACLCGTVAMIVGWVGFTAGSPFHVDMQMVSVAANGVLAAFAGGCAASALAFAAGGKTSARDAQSGVVAGLISVTAGGPLFDSFACGIAAMIGAAIVLQCRWWLKRAGFDSRTRLIVAYAVVSVWGSLAVALLAVDPGDFVGGTRWEQFAVQGIGSAAAFIWAFGVVGLVLYVVKAMHVLDFRPCETDSCDVDSYATGSSDTIEVRPAAVKATPTVPVEDHPDSSATEPLVFGLDKVEIDCGSAGEMSRPDDDRTVVGQAAEQHEAVARTGDDACSKTTVDSKPTGETSLVGEPGEVAGASEGGVRVERPRTRVLVMGDNETRLEQMDQLLDNEAYEVVCSLEVDATSFIVAAADGAGLPYDVIMLSADMESFDAVEVSASVRGRAVSEKLRIVLFGETADVVPTDEAELVGVNAVLSCPCDAVDLREAFDRASESLLKMACEEHRSSEQLTVGEEETDVQAGLLDGVRVLVVDDNNVCREFYSYAVAAHGAEVVSVDNVDAAIREIDLASSADSDCRSFDAIVIDAADDRLSSLAIAEYVRGRELEPGEKRVRVVEMVAAESRVATDDASVIEKPIDADTLIEAIHETLLKPATALAKTALAKTVVEEAVEEVAIEAADDVADHATDSIATGLSECDSAEVAQPAIEEVELAGTIGELASSVVDEEIPPELLIDLVELGARCLHDDEFLVAVLEQFSTELPHGFGRITTAAEVGAWSRVVEAADAMEGFASNVAAYAVQESATTLHSLATPLDREADGGQEHAEQEHAEQEHERPDRAGQDSAILLDRQNSVRREIETLDQRIAATLACIESAINERQSEPV